MDFHNKDKDYYKNLRPEMLSFLPQNSKRILDIGCADGYFSKALKEKNNAEVWGIELMSNVAKKTSKKIDKVLEGAIEDVIYKLPDNYFDAIYFNL